MKHLMNAYKYMYYFFNVKHVCHSCIIRHFITILRSYIHFYTLKEKRGNLIYSLLDIMFSSTVLSL